jgi:low temperature requirement protein LtrA
MPIISLIVILVIIGVILWAVNTYIPMDAKIKQIMNIVVVIAVCIWLLTLFFPGALSMGNIPVGRVR